MKNASHVICVTGQSQESINSKDRALFVELVEDQREASLSTQRQEKESLLGNSHLGNNNLHIEVVFVI